jgi:RecA-family ATPase
VNAADVAAAIGGKQSGTGWIAKCVCHDDSTPSLSITDGDGTVLIHCHAGCEQDVVLDALRDRGIDLRKPNGHDRLPFSVATFAQAKQLKHGDLKARGVQDVALDGGQAAIGFEYRDRDNQVTGVKYRRGLSGERGFFWRKGSRTSLYGLWRLADMHELDGRLILCEGESDALTLWQHDFAALGLPGASMWKEEWIREIPEGDQVYVVIEPDKGGEAVKSWLAKSALRYRAMVITMTSHKDPSALYLSDPENFATNFEKLIEQAQPWSDPTDDKPKRLALDWSRLASRTPPDRQWARPGWLGIGHATLCAGGAGVGKTLIAQTTATATAMDRAYISESTGACVSLMWAGEDDHDELWRRQQAINAHFNIEMTALTGKLYLESFDGRDMILAEPSAEFRGRLLTTPLLAELREQVGDYRATAVILDTVARIYAGNENDRVMVTQFLHLLMGAMPHPVALLLLAHPSRGQGAEYSGSSAWEGSVRNRWYFGRTLPDAKPEDDAIADDSIRYLARRKSNYSARDWIALTYDTDKHLLIPQAPAGSADDWYRKAHTTDVLIRGLRELIRRNTGHPTGAYSSPRYLPKMIQSAGLTEKVSTADLRMALNQALADGRLAEKSVGRDRARRDISGLIEVRPS